MPRKTTHHIPYTIDEYEPPRDSSRHEKGAINDLTKDDWDYICHVNRSKEFFNQLKWLENEARQKQPEQKLEANINNHEQSERQRKWRDTGKLVTGGVLATGISFAVIHKTAILGLCLAHPVAALAVAALVLTALIVSAMMLCKKKYPCKKDRQKHNEKNTSPVEPFTDPSQDLSKNSWFCCF